MIKAKAKQFKQIEREANSRSKNAYMKKLSHSSSKKVISIKREKGSKIEKYHIEPCVEMKILVEYQPFKERAYAKEVAVILEELLQAAGKEDHQFTLQDKFRTKKIMNPYLKKRLEEEKRMREREKENKKQFALHQQDLKKLLETKPLQKAKKKSSMRSKHLKFLQKSLSKKDEMKLEQFKKEQKEKLDEYRAKIKESKVKLKERKAKEHAETERKIQQMEEYFKKNKEEMEKKFRKISEKRKNELKMRKSFSSIKKERDALKEKNLQYCLQKKVELNKERKDKKERLDAVLFSPEYKQHITFNNSKYETVFKHYYSSLMRDEILRQPERMLNQELYLRFVVDFKIVPLFLTPKNNMKAFNKIQAMREDKKIATQGVTFKEFREFGLQFILTQKVSSFLKKLFEKHYKVVLEGKPEELKKKDSYLSQKELDEKNTKIRKNNYLRAIKESDLAVLEGYILFLGVPDQGDYNINNIIKLHSNMNYSTSGSLTKSSPEKQEQEPKDKEEENPDREE